MIVQMTKSNIMRLANQLIEQLSFQEDDDFVASITSAVCNEEQFPQDDIQYFADKELAEALEILDRITE